MYHPQHFGALVSNELLIASSQLRAVAAAIAVAVGIMDFIAAWVCSG